jgi:hypothetical protein
MISSTSVVELDASRRGTAAASGAVGSAAAGVVGRGPARGGGDTAFDHLVDRVSNTAALLRGRLEISSKSAYFPWTSTTTPAGRFAASRSPQRGFATR